MTKCMCVSVKGKMANVYSREKQLAHLFQISKYILSVNSILTSQALLIFQLSTPIFGLTLCLLSLEDPFMLAGS